MTDDQTAIPVEAAKPTPARCAWCGKRATNEVPIEPARYRNHNGVRVEAKAARVAPVCAAHYRSLHRVGL